MKIYDITQEVFSCCVFPGDPSPVKKQVLHISKGDICNLTEIAMCAHNGTHVDAPYHFLEDGKKIDELDLHKVIGDALVIAHEGELTAEDVYAAIRQDSPKRILFKGKTVVTLEAAKALNCLGVVLVGVESQTVGPENGPMAVHLELLGKEVVLLEGIRLSKVPEGRYFLNTAPLKLGGADGAPCRSILISMDDEAEGKDGRDEAKEEASTEGTNAGADEYPEFLEPVNILAGVSLFVKEVFGPATGLTYVLDNRSGRDLNFGQDFSLQREKDGKWYVLESKAPMAVTMQLLWIPDRCTDTYEINWEVSYGELPKGHYRIIKSVADDKQGYYMAGEFDVA